MYMYLSMCVIVLFLQIYPDPERLEEGMLVRLYGIVDYKLWKLKKKYFHSVSVVYYQRMSHDRHAELSMYMYSVSTCTLCVCVYV